DRPTPPVHSGLPWLPRRRSSAPRHRPAPRPPRRQPTVPAPLPDLPHGRPRPADPHYRMGGDADPRSTGGINDQQRSGQSRRLRPAFMRSRFMTLMVSMLISLGHTAAHSPMLVQVPNPIRSMALTMLTTRARRSG